MRRFILLSCATLACAAGERVEALELFSRLRNRPTEDSIQLLPTPARQSWFDTSASYADEVIYDGHAGGSLDAWCGDCGDCADCCCLPRLRCGCRRMMARARHCCRGLIRCCLPESCCCEPDPCCDELSCCPKRSCRLFSRLRFRPDCCPYCDNAEGDVAFGSWSDEQATEVVAPSDAAANASPSRMDSRPTPWVDLSI